MVKPEKKKKIAAIVKPKHKSKGNKLVEKLENAHQQDAPSKIKRMLSYREREAEGKEPKPKRMAKPEITFNNTTLDELEKKSAHLASLAARKKTKKYLKKQQYLNRKEEKPEMDLGLITEQKLIKQGNVKFQDFVLEPPRLTVIPKDRSKKKVLIQPTEQTFDESNKKAPKQINISAITGGKLGRSRKLKSLPEVERNALLIQRQKAIDFYRLQHKK